MSKEFNTLDRSKSKKEKVLEQKPHDRKGPILAAFVAMVVATGLGFHFWKSPSTVATNDSPAHGITTTAEGVSYPLTVFDDGVARHFEQQFGEITVRYFILKSSDGVVRAAFDACDVCWPEGKGYQQQGDVMVCRNCGRQFPSIRINEVKGGCNPAPLKRNIEDDRLVIRTLDIEKGRAYFDFKGKV
jgi:uncharacterized membrane protein